MKYRPELTAEQEQALLADCQWLDQCYADAAEAEASDGGDLEEQEYFDPVRDGWVDRNTGRP
jgi:hypothetical protein